MESSSKELENALRFSIGEIVTAENAKCGSKRKMSGAAVSTLTEIVMQYSKVLADDLKLFAKHAKRSRIGVEDVKLVARKAGPGVLRSLSEFESSLNEQGNNPNPKAKGAGGGAAVKGGGGGSSSSKGKGSSGGAAAASKRRLDHADEDADVMMLLREEGGGGKAKAKADSHGLSADGIDDEELLRQVALRTGASNRKDMPMNASKGGNAGGGGDCSNGGGVRGGYGGYISSGSDAAANGGGSGGGGAGGGGQYGGRAYGMLDEDGEDDDDDDDPLLL